MKILLTFDEQRAWRIENGRATRADRLWCKARRVKREEEQAAFRQERELMAKEYYSDGSEIEVYLRGLGLDGTAR